MKLDRVDHLLARYYEGETTGAEEKELRAFFESTPLLPDHLKSHAAAFTFYKRQQAEEADKFLADDWYFQKIENPAPAKPAFKGQAYWRVAAAIALLVVAFWAGNQYRRGDTASQDPEVAVLRREVLEMKQVLAASSSASDRIRVVSQDFGAAPDEEVIDLLIKTLHQDPNVNVRLAACEGLYQFKDEPKVRAAFLQALEKQHDPLVQITLIDILIGLREKKALEPLKQLTQKENLLPAVKQKARQGIGILI
jgi:HEAT repeats